jgi:uncharacterized protein YciI
MLGAGDIERFDDGGELMQDLTMDEIRGRLAGVPLFAVFERTTEKYQGGGTPEGRELLRQHLLYLLELDEQGKLFAAGPLAAAESEGYAGMFILAAGSQEEAERLAYDEPMHRAGWRQNVVRGWTLNEGFTCGVTKQTLASKSA